MRIWAAFLRTWLLFAVIGVALLVWAGEPLSMPAERLGVSDTKQQTVAVLEIELHGQGQRLEVTGKVLPDSITVWLTAGGQSMSRVYLGRLDTTTGAR